MTNDNHKPNETVGAAAVACSNLLGVIVMPKMPVNHLPASATTPAALHATHQSSAALLMSASVDPAKLLSVWLAALRALTRRWPVRESSHECLAVAMAAPSNYKQAADTKRRTPRQLMATALNRMAAKLCAPHRGKSLTTYEKAYQAHSTQLVSTSYAAMTPNETSSPTAGGGSGGAQPKGTNEK
jgi:hypothetical protein